MNHIGNGFQNRVEKFDMEQFEHLEFATCTYSDQGIHSLCFKTNTERQFIIEGDAGPGNKKRTINLKDHCKAIIGFRGVFDENLEDLYIYVAPRLDVLNEGVIAMNSQGSHSD
jgi:hypothetical protein